MEFTLDIEYTLDSLDDGVLSVGFNTDRPNAYRIVETRAIGRGPIGSASRPRLSLLTGRSAVNFG